MIRRLDRWVGLRLFHPPIVWLCQQADMTQYALARYAWMAATLTFVARIGSSPYSTGTAFAVFATVMALTSTIGAALFAHVPTRPSFPMRLLIWGIGIILLTAWLRGLRGNGAFFWEMTWELLALTGEYAKTIGTIPPRKRPDQRRAGSQPRWLHRISKGLHSAGSDRS